MANNPEPSRWAKNSRGRWRRRSHQSTSRASSRAMASSPSQRSRSSCGPDRLEEVGVERLPVAADRQVAPEEDPRGALVGRRAPAQRRDLDRGVETAEHLGAGADPHTDGLEVAPVLVPAEHLVACREELRRHLLEAGEPVHEVLLEPLAHRQRQQPWVAVDGCPGIDRAVFTPRAPGGHQPAHQVGHGDRDVESLPWRLSGPPPGHGVEQQGRRGRWIGELPGLGRRGAPLAAVPIFAAGFVRAGPLSHLRPARRPLLPCRLRRFGCAAGVLAAHPLRRGRGSRRRPGAPPREFPFRSPLRTIT
jgi:hypothetical protein